MGDKTNRGSEALGEIFSSSFPLIGVVHLPAFPGYEKSLGFQHVLDCALKDAETLTRAGFQGILLENEYDQPHRIKAGPETISVLTAVAREVVKSVNLPVGVEVLLNDPPASLAIALASGARFIRTDYFVDEMFREEYGEMEAKGKDWVEYRRKIGAEHVAIFADIQVKYATLKFPKALETSAQEAKEVGAQGVIVSGAATGQEPSVDELARTRRSVSPFPLLIGSGFSAHNAALLVPQCDGVLVGTSVITNGRIDGEKARHLRETVDQVLGARP